MKIGKRADRESTNGQAILPSESIEESPHKPEKDYDIKWDKDKIKLSTEVEGMKVWGCWRKTKIENTILYAIDLWIQSDNQPVSVESIGYDIDPREKIRSLNKDICMALNRFLYRTRSLLHGVTLESLVAQSRQPTLIFSSIASLDQVLTGLTIFRTQAIRKGGQRYYNFVGDQDRSPRVILQCDFSSETLRLKGMIPPISTAGFMAEPTGEEDEDGVPTIPEKKAILHSVAQREGHRMSRSKRFAGLPDTVAELIEAKAVATDPRQKKLIRAKIRAIRKGTVTA